MYARLSREASSEPPPPNDVRTARDRARLDAIQRGDVAAFEALFREYSAPLAGFVYRYLRSREAAEDVVQELFLDLWQRRDTVIVRTNVRTYLYTIARNHALSTIRHRKVELRWREQRAALGETEQTDDPEAPEDTLVAQELEAHIAHAIANLSERSRQVFLMNRQEQLTYQEIADILGLSVKTVEMHMSRALVVLRAACEGWR